MGQEQCGRRQSLVYGRLRQVMQENARHTGTIIVNSELVSEKILLYTVLYMYKYVRYIAPVVA